VVATARRHQRKHIGGCQRYACVNNGGQQQTPSLPHGGGFLAAFCGPSARRMEDERANKGGSEIGDMGGVLRYTHRTRFRLQICLTSSARSAKRRQRTRRTRRAGGDAHSPHLHGGWRRGGGVRRAISASRIRLLPFLVGDISTIADLCWSGSRTLTPLLRSITAGVNGSMAA